MRNVIGSHQIFFSFYSDLCLEASQSANTLPKHYEWGVDRVRGESFYVWVKWNKVSVVTTPDCFLLYNKFVCVRGTKSSFTKIKADVVEILEGKTSLSAVAENEYYTVMSRKNLFVK